MPSRFGSSLPVIVGLLLLACQGDRESPVEPGRPLELAGACAKTLEGTTFEAEVTLYKDKKVQADKISQCAIIQRAGDGSIGSETGINQLLVALYADFAAGGGAFKGGWVPQDVVDFAEATCDLDPSLAQTGDVDCVVPTVENLGTTGPTAEGWIAVKAGLNAIVELPSEEFGIKIENLEAGVTEVFVALRENPPTIAGTSGCPGGDDSNFDCESPNYTIDMDSPVDIADENDPIAGNGLYVEMCDLPNGFAEIPGRCEGGQCAPGIPVAQEDLLGFLQCTIGSRSLKPSTWAGMDSLEATRGIRCLAIPHANVGSEGIVCKFFGPVFGTSAPAPGAFPATPDTTCQTTVIGTSQAACTVTGFAATDTDSLTVGEQVWYMVVGEKVAGSGSHSGFKIDFLSQESPPLVPGVKEFRVDVLPQGQQ